jgi:hypothetical protein
MRRVAETIAERLGLVQRTTGGEQPAPEEFDPRITDPIAASFLDKSPI